MRDRRRRRRRALAQYWLLKEKFLGSESVHSTKEYFK